MKMNPFDENTSIYIYFNKENNKKSPKFEGSGHTRILKYKNIFAKGYVPNWSGKGFPIKKSL